MESTPGSILRFICRTAAMALPVLAGAAIWYVAADPYKALRHYDTYFPDPAEVPARVSVNKGMVTLANYADRTAEGHRYNGFIFGSSISCYYDAADWASRQAGHTEAIHFDSSGESLRSMARKVQWLDRAGAPIEYALVVLDPVIMGSDNDSQPYAIDPVELRPGLLHFVRFHYTLFRAAANMDFMKSWLPHVLAGSGENNGRNMVFEPQPIVYDPATNSEYIPLWDAEISADPVQFYSRHKLDAPADRPSTGQAVLTPEREEAIASIAEVFGRHGTDYHIVVSPNRRKITLNPADAAILQKYFAPSRVHDFSLSMAAFLECDTLLYDSHHYRPAFARQIMDSIYSSAAGSPSPALRLRDNASR